MNLNQLYAQLQEFLEQHPERGNHELVLPVATPSVGYSATVGISHLREGMDWDHGRMFLRPTEPVIPAAPFSTKEIKEHLDHILEIRKKHDKDGGGLAFPKNRADCYAEGYREGARFGSLRLMNSLSEFRRLKVMEEGKYGKENPGS